VGHNELKEKPRPWIKGPYDDSKGKKRGVRAKGRPLQKRGGKRGPLQEKSPYRALEEGTRSRENGRLITEGREGTVGNPLGGLTKRKKRTSSFSASTSEGSGARTTEFAVLKKTEAALEKCG